MSSVLNHTKAGTHEVQAPSGAVLNFPSRSRACWPMGAEAPVDKWPLSLRLAFLGGVTAATWAGIIAAAVWALG